MGQSQAYKRRHPGRQGQISAQEYTGLTFRGIAAARRTEGEDSRARQQGARSARTGQVTQQPGQGQTAQAQVRQGRPGTEYRARQQGDAAGQAHRPRTAGRATQHAGQARQQRDEASQGPGDREHRDRGDHLKHETH